MAELLLLFFLAFGWPLLVPAVFLSSHGGHMTSRGLFYILGVLISYGASFAGPIIWGLLLGFFSFFVILASGPSEQAIESTFAFAFPVHMGMTWILLPPTGLSILVSVGALKMLACRFERVDPDSTETTDAPEPRPGPA
jgi:hypothetical protein